MDLEVYWNSSICNLCEYTTRGDVMHRLAWFCGAREFSASEVVVLLEELCEANFFGNRKSGSKGYV